MTVIDNTNKPANPNRPQPKPQSMPDTKVVPLHRIDPSPGGGHRHNESPPPDTITPKKR